MGQTAVRPTLSLYEEGRREAERHKWIESQKRGMDVGNAAVDEWYRRHWPHYCRHKRLEHLVGCCLWREFSPQDFGLIEKLIVRNDLLLDRVLDRLREGWENLNVILWALEWGMPIDRVIAILTALDINSARLDPNNT